MVEKDRLNSLLHIIEQKDILRNILEVTLDNDGIRTLIGEEISDVKVIGCSMVSASYKIGNKKVGVIGVIGPTRMDYRRAISTVGCVSEVLSDLVAGVCRSD